MRGLSLLLLVGLLCIQKSTAQKPDPPEMVIMFTKNADWTELRCTGGMWDNNIPEHDQFKHIDVDLNKDIKFIKTCHNKEQDKYKEPGSTPVQVYVKVRTCDTCLELDPLTLAAIFGGSILTTALIAVAVYSLSAQPKGKSFSGNKASDRVNLIPNGEGDTYQQLAPGQKSEYQTLTGARGK